MNLYIDLNSAIPVGKRPPCCNDEWCYNNHCHILLGGRGAEFPVFDSAAEEIADSRDVVNLQVIETTIADLRKSARTIIKRREDRKSRRRLWRQEVLRKARLIWGTLSDLVVYRTLSQFTEAEVYYGVRGAEFLSVDVGREGYCWSDVRFSSHLHDTLQYYVQQYGLRQKPVTFVFADEVEQLPDHYLRCGPFGPTVEHVRLSNKRWALDNCATCRAHHERLMAFMSKLVDDVWRANLGEPYPYDFIQLLANCPGGQVEERRFVMCGSGV